jgi:hypothetical protein
MGGAVDKGYSKDYKNQKFDDMCNVSGSKIAHPATDTGPCL